MTVPDFEWEEGYPTEESETAVSGLDFETMAEAWEWLKNNLETCSQNCCASFKLVDSEDAFNRPRKHIHFSTGGWSGAETVMEYIESRLWARHLMLKWERGGHYVFESPNPS